MSEKTQVVSGGVSGFTLLGILFIGLKLTGHITWPWVWVLSPFWIPWAIILSILLLCGGVILVAAMLDKR